MLSHKICNEGEKNKCSKILLEKTLKYKVNIQTETAFCVSPQNAGPLRYCT